MITVLSPAKSLDFETPLATDRSSEPRFAERADELAQLLARRSASELARLMSVSPALAELNADRFVNWDAAAEQARPAILAFHGDVYRGMDAPASFDTRDYTQAQKTLRILSGLYGLLQPLDRIRPYRLEMGTGLANGRGDDLYAYWGTELADALRTDIDASPGTGVLVNLASKEYFAAVDTDALERRVVSPVFLDAGGDAEPRIISFHAKRARGAMAGWMVRERITRVSHLTRFARLGYAHDPDRSDPDHPVFVRRHPPER